MQWRWVAIDALVRWGVKFCSSMSQKNWSMKAPSFGMAVVVAEGFTLTTCAACANVRQVLDSWRALGLTEIGVRLGPVDPTGHRCLAEVYVRAKRPG